MPRRKASEARFRRELAGLGAVYTYSSKTKPWVNDRNQRDLARVVGHWKAVLPTSLLFIIADAWTLYLSVVGHRIDS
jgi:hypothetical protein